MNVTRRASPGLTLVEILTALFVLSIGLAGVLSIIVRSSEMGNTATDRNNASIIIPEAIEDIKKMLLITDSSFGAQHVGEYMDTVDLGTSNNPYSEYEFTMTTKTNAQIHYRFKNLAYGIPTVDNVTLRPLYLCYWPLNTVYGRVMGQFPQPTAVGVDPTLNNVTPCYRGLFKLEPHPEWIPDPSTRIPLPDSGFAGVYVLTFTLYRDLTPEKDTTKLDKRLQQVCDPVVVWIRDKKTRS
jgi:hypothetical protein